MMQTASTFDYPSLGNYEIRWEPLYSVHFGFELLGILHYIIVLCILLFSSDKSLNKPFYSFFKIGAANDIVVAIATVFLRVSKEMGLCNDWDYVVRFCTFLTGSNLLIHYMWNASIITLRMTALTPSSLNPLAVKTYQCVCCFGIFASIAIYAATMPIPFGYEIKDSFCERIPRPCEGNYLGISRLISAAFVAIFMFYLLIFIPLLLTKIYKHNKTAITKTSKFLYGHVGAFSIIQFFGFLFELFYEILRFFDLDKTNVLFSFISDNFLTYFYILMIMSGIVVVFTQQDLRYKYFFFLKKNTVGLITETVAQPQNQPPAA